MLACGRMSRRPAREAIAMLRSPSRSVTQLHNGATLPFQILQVASRGAAAESRAFGDIERAGSVRSIVQSLHYQLQCRTVEVLGQDLFGRGAHRRVQPINVLLFDLIQCGESATEPLITVQRIAETFEVERLDNVAECSGRHRAAE